MRLTPLAALTALVLSMPLVPTVPLQAETIFSEDFESGVLGAKWEGLSQDSARASFETRPEFVHS